MTSISLQETFEDLLQDQQKIVYRPIYQKITGCDRAALLCSNLVYWSTKMQHKEFYKTDLELRKETGLTRHKFKAAKKKLVDLELFYIHRKGVLGKTYYQISLEKFIGLLSTGHIKTCQQDGRKPANKMAGFRPSRWPKTGHTTSTTSSTTHLSNKTTTNTKTQRQSVRSELVVVNLKNFDFSNLDNIGFNHSHLNQLINYNKLSHEQIQESINHFAFDLKYNGKGSKIKVSPINYFMGILIKGIPYAASSNYEDLKAREARLCIEAKERAEAEAQQSEQAMKASEFREWLDTIGEEGLKSFCKADNELSDNLTLNVRLKKLKAYENASRHFNEHIWPVRGQDRVGSIEGCPEFEECLIVGRKMEAGDRVIGGVG